MAGFIPSFSSGSSLVIQVDGVTLAYASNLSFSDDVPHAAIGGVGSYNYDTIEPLQYASRGGFSITHYDKQAVQAINNGAASGVSYAPDRANSNGNTMLRARYFSPLLLLTQKTFDIDVYERKNTSGTSSNDLIKAFTISDCRLTSYSITFTPGQLVAENIGFICLGVTDNIVTA